MPGGGTRSRCARSENGPRCSALFALRNRALQRTRRWRRPRAIARLDGAYESKTHRDSVETNGAIGLAQGQRLRHRGGAGAPRSSSNNSSSHTPASGSARVRHDLGSRCDGKCVARSMRRVLRIERRLAPLPLPARTAFATPCICSSDGPLCACPAPSLSVLLEGDRTVNPLPKALPALTPNRPRWLSSTGQDNCRRPGPSCRTNWTGVALASTSGASSNPVWTKG